MLLKPYISSLTGRRIHANSFFSFLKMRFRMGKVVLAFFLLQAMLFLILISAIYTHSTADEQFDVRQHLSTVSSYGAVPHIGRGNSVPSAIPDGCKPIHLNLVARHGTRSPTKKRMRELDRLAASLESLIRNANERKLSLRKVPTWLVGWKSPWEGKLKGGELISKGEDEHYNLGIRTRERFPDLFSDDYHPDVYTIKATQVARASASAVAFGMGIFGGKGSLGPGKHRAFAVSTESRASDILLRFYDTCQNYKEFRESQEPAVEKLKEPIFNEISAVLSKRYNLNFTRHDISSLWFLCKQEASLLDITTQACGLFEPSEVSLLEWTDDLEFFILKGYGKAVNYRMGAPLLEDIIESMESAMKADEEGYPHGSFEKARLRFAHAETVVPFSCLLGLFLDGSEYEMIRKEQPLPLPPKPPQKRNWRGSIVAPFAGNNMLVLYRCPAKNSHKYYVQALHNELPISMPGCHDSDFCPFEVFKERVAMPHLKHDFNSVCKAKVGQQPVQKPATSKLKLLFRWLFSVGKGDAESQKVDL